MLVIPDQKRQVAVPADLVKNRAYDLPGQYSFDDHEDHHRLRLEQPHLLAVMMALHPRLGAVVGTGYRRWNRATRFGSFGPS